MAKKNNKKTTCDTVICNFLDLGKLLLGSLQQQPQIFRYLVPPIPYDIHYFLPVMIKNCKFSCLLLIWQQTVIAAKRSTVRCGDDDHTDLELQIWEKFLQFLRDTWGNPSSEHAPPAALPLSLTSVGKISFTLLGLPTAPCPNLFSSRGTKASIQASPNPNPLSIDSQKSFALYCQGVSSSIQRSIHGWTRKPIRTGTSL